MLSDLRGIDLPADTLSSHIVRSRIVHRREHRDLPCWQGKLKGGEGWKTRPKYAAPLYRKEFESLFAVFPRRLLILYSRHHVVWLTAIIMVEAVIENASAAYCQDREEGNHLRLSEVQAIVR